MKYWEAVKAQSEGKKVVYTKSEGGNDYPLLTESKWDGFDFKVVEEKKIDWSLMPKGTLVYVRTFNGGWTGAPLYFVAVDNDGYATSATKKPNQYLDIRRYSKIKLAKDQPIIPWFGDGECPVPNGVIVRLWLKSGDFINEHPTSLRWTVSNASDDIIAYQIIGIKDGYVEC